MDNQLSMEQAILRWLEHLKSQGAAVDTYEAYQRDLKHLAACYPTLLPHAFSQTHLLHALARLHSEGMQPRSLARMVSAWRNFFNWFCVQTKSSYNPTLGLHAPQGNYPDPKILSIEQTERLLNTAAPGPHASATELRDQAIFELLYSSGLRLAEIVALDLHAIDNESYQSRAWIDIEQQEVHIIAKDERQRSIPIGEPAIQAITRWLDQRSNLLRPMTDPLDTHELNQQAALFLGVRGQRISPRVIQKQLQLRAKQVGLTQAVYPHRLRNSFANHLLESSNDVRGVQQLLGHSSTQSTQSLQQLSPEQLAQFFAAHPRHKKTS